MGHRHRGSTGAWCYDRSRLRQGHALEDRVKKSFYKKVTSDQGFEG